MRKTAPRGFTLVELLVVTAIIAVLISLLLPALKKARAQAKTVVCLAQLRQLAVAGFSYAGSYGGVTPLGSDGEGRNPIPDANGKLVWWHYYWDHFYAEAGLTEVVGGKLICPNVVTGVYGMAQSLGQGDFSSYPFGTSYSSDPYSFKGSRLAQVRQPSQIVFFADSVRQYEYPGPLSFTGSGRVQRGGQSFQTSYIYQTGVQSQAVWLAHNDGVANVLFVDGHALSAGPDDLLGVMNANKSAALNKHGIDAYWNLDGQVVDLY